MNIKERALELLQNLKALVLEAEHEGVTNEQWYLDWEDELNTLSCKDHTL